MPFTIVVPAWPTIRRSTVDALALARLMPLIFTLLDSASPMPFAGENEL